MRRRPIGILDCRTDRIRTGAIIPYQTTYRRLPLARYLDRCLLTPVQIVQDEERLVPIRALVLDV